MKKTFCDMCEKETINPRVIKIDVHYSRTGGFGTTASGLEERAYDICEKCRVKILTIIGIKEKLNEEE